MNMKTVLTFPDILVRVLRSTNALEEKSSTKQTESTLTVYILVSIALNPNCLYACAYFATTDTTMADRVFSADALLHFVPRVMQEGGQANIGDTIP